MKSTYILFLILAVTVCTVTGPARASECRLASFEMSEGLSTATMAELVVVNHDGTLSLSADAFQKIPTGQREWARESLLDLNSRIKNGYEEPFTTQDHRLNLSPRVKHTSQSEFLVTSSPDDQNMAIGACFCDDGCCDVGLCCASGWWLFCWQFGAC